MLVSIAICTYNGEKFIEEQLLSLLNQSYSNIEIVVCDDASTDATIGILRKYASDEKVKLLLNESNIGAYKSFEKAITHCSGSYIALADQDDIWKKDKIKRLMENFSGHPLIYHDSELVSEEGKLIGKRISDLRNLGSVTDSRGFIFSNCVWGHAAFFDIKLKDSILPIPDKVPHDAWIAYVATCMGGIQYLPQPLVMYRQHDQTYTSTLPPKEIAKRSDRQKKKAYLHNLNWIDAMQRFPYNDHKGFYTKLLHLYKQREKGAFCYPLFFFLLKHRRTLYQFAKKSWFSQVNEIRKQCRGVKMID